MAVALPDLSHGYFPNLERPKHESVKISREGGPVILIVVDAMRPDRLTPYGFKRNTSPNLNALADEGVVLTNYYVNGNWTRPSTATIVTGELPGRHGVERDRDSLAEHFATLAGELSKKGIPTGAVVGNGNAGSAFGLGRGFQYYADTTKHWKGLPSAQQVVDLAVPYVRDHKDEPFFLLLFFVDPHDPYHAPGKYEDIFVENKDVPLIRSPHWELGNYSSEKIHRMQSTYDGAVRYTDGFIGGFLDELRSLGIYDKSTIMVTSDHGEAFGEHGVFLHAHHLWDEIIRAPFIIRAPKMSKRGGYNHHLFQTIDVLPTIVSYFGGQPPEGLPGVNMMTHLATPSLNKANRIAITEFDNFGIRRSTIRSYTRKIILHEKADSKAFESTVGRRSLLPSVNFDSEEVQFFSLKKDPFEKKDIYTPKMAKKAAWRKLTAKLKRYRATRAKDGISTHVVHKLDPETEADLRALGYIR